MFLSNKSLIEFNEMFCPIENRFDPRIPYHSNHNGL